MNAQERLLERARKVMACVYIATEKGPADDIADCIGKLIAEIQRQDRHMERLGNKKQILYSPFRTLPPEVDLKYRIDYARTHRFEDE